MKKSQLVEDIAVAADLNKKQAQAALDAVVEAICSRVEVGENVRIAGFGTFELKSRAERAGVNPQTGEKITIAASKTVGFKPGSELKARVNR